MRIAAIPDLGRGEPLESTLRSDSYYVLENEEYSTFISPDGNWHTFHPSIEFVQSQGRTCQLERQDQLQEMVSKDKPISLVDDLNYFCFPMDRLGVMPHKRAMVEAEKQENYIASFASMEQLWLAFVMKEKYNKTWDGEQWDV